MRLTDELRQLRAELRTYVRQVVANAIQYTQFTLSGASGEHDKVAGHKTEGGDEQPYDYEVRRLQHFGLRSRPPKDVWTLRVAATAGSTNNVTVAEDSTRYGPSDLDDGEVAVYCKVQNVIIRLFSDGSVEVTDKAGSQLLLDGKGNVSLDGNAITLAGPGPAVGRVGDAVQVTIPANAVMVPGNPPTPNASPITLSGTITQGSPKVSSG